MKTIRQKTTKRNPRAAARPTVGRQYRVVWEVDVWAGNPGQAAQQALDIQRDPESKATCFEVHMVGPCPRCKRHQLHKEQCPVVKENSGQPYPALIGCVHCIDLDGNPSKI